MEARLSGHRLIAAVALAAASGSGCGRVPSLPGGTLRSVEQIRELLPQQVASGVQARLTGVVTYAYASDDVCFLQDATGGIRIQLRPGQMVGEPGKQMEVWGTVSAGGAAPALMESRFTLGGEAKLPAAEPLRGTGDGTHGRLYRRVSVTGVVQSANDDHPDIPRLALRVGAALVRVKALSPRFSDTGRLIDAEIRIDGVLVATPTSGNLDGMEVWAPALSDAVILKPAPAAAACPRRTAASLQDLKPEQLPAHRVLVRGRVRISAAGLASIEDTTGTINVLLSDGSKTLSGAGTRSLVGFAAVRDGHLVLANAEDAGSTQDVSPALPVKTTARAVHRLSADQAAREYPVRLRGVVTYSDSFNGTLFIQDRTDGIFVSLDDSRASLLRTGDEIEVTGVTAPGSFAPSVTKAHFKILGRIRLPVPARDDLESVFEGLRDCRWIELAGIIQSVARGSRDTVAQVVSGTHRFQARILAPVKELAGFVNAEVSLRGVAGALFNDRRQMLGVVVYVPGLEYIGVRRAAPADPFDLPLRPASTLLEFSSGTAPGHRVRVQGVVTASEPLGPTVLWDATGAVLVKSHDEARLKPGDVAEAAGFPESGPYSPVLTDALIRRIGSGPPPVPRIVAASQLLEGHYDGELVRVDGTVMDRTPLPDRVRLLLKSGNAEFTAVLPGRGVSQAVRPGTVVRLTGICVLQVDDSREAVSPRFFDIRMRTPADLTVVKQPSWLTFERLLPIFLITLAVAGASLNWAARLRRRLNTQANALLQKTAQLEKEHLQTTRALRRAREAEVMEQAHKRVLELVARDEDLGSVMARLAEAVEEHCLGVTCSIQLRLPGGSRLSASPGLSSDWQQMLSKIDIEEFCKAGVHPLQDLTRTPEWAVFAETHGHGRFHRLCLAPIERDSRTIGAVIAFLGGEIVLRRAERDFLFSASQLAALALERRALYDRLSYQARHDELTGLENRAALLARLSAGIASAAANGGLLGVIYIDLDNFKNTNDTYGHAAGDAVLREVARRMRGGIRRRDALARLGGDEFVAVLPSLGQAADAHRIAEQLATSLSRPVAFCGEMLETGASVGVSIYPADGEDAETLLRAADVRMYHDKVCRRVPTEAHLAS